MSRTRSFSCVLALAVLLARLGSLACLAQITLLSPPPPPPPPSAPPLAQSETPATPLHGPYRIAGRVVDSLDGHPLRRVGIALYDIHAPNQKLVAEVQANAEGGFSVADLPAGKFRVQASAPGYIAAAYDAHGQYSSAIVTGAGLPTESLVFRLVPAATFHGRVTDEAGDPVQNATISIFRENNDTGVRKITLFRNGRTDDLGDYEITRLTPGTYYAAVRATPWYATYPPSDVAANNGFSVAVDVSPALNVTYPLTFYPEATESNGASPIVLKAGDRFHADFHLTPQPAVRLTIGMPSATGGNGRTFPQLQQKVFDTLQPVPQQRVENTPAGVEIPGLAAGTYVLRENGPNGLTGATRRVDLTGGSVSMQAVPPASYSSVKLSLDPSSEPLPARAQLALRKLDPGDDAGQSRRTAPLKDGQAEFPGVEPGEYRVETTNSRFHVDSVTEDGKTHAGALLHVTGSGQAVTVAVGAGNVQVSGFTRQNGKAVSGVMVVLVPASGGYSADLYRRDQSDLDGSFEFANVIPGNYLVVAISDGWSLEWGKPEVLAPYLLKATPLAVAVRGSPALKMEESVTVQPR